MDWYLGSSDELSDRLPSPESWAKWGISEPETYHFANKGSVVDANLTREQLNLDSEILSNEVEMEGSATYDKDQTSSSIDGGYSDEFLHRTALSCDQLAYQLDGLARFDQMDDLFLSSLIEDLPSTENVQESFCFEPENDMVFGDSISTEMSLYTQSVSSDTCGMGNSKYLKTHAFSPSAEKDTVSALPNSEKKPCQLLTAPQVKIMVPSQHDSVNGNADEETSPEEFVLQEIEMVMAQLTDKTRICFRDAFYRLAKNSMENAVMTKRNGSLSLENSAETDQDEKTSHGEKKTTELDTNTIDRAIANMMFNEMDINVHEFPVLKSATSNQQTLKAARRCNYSLNEPQFHDLPCYPNFARDAAEVPSPCQGYLQTMQFGA